MTSESRIQEYDSQTQNEFYKIISSNKIFFVRDEIICSQKEHEECEENEECEECEEYEEYEECDECKKCEECEDKEYHNWLIIAEDCIAFNIEYDKWVESLESNTDLQMLHVSI